MSDPAFRRVGIAGLGLIGGSVALRARAAWPDATVLGFDRASQLEEAKRRGVVDVCTSRIADLSDADVVVLAVPVSAMADLMVELGRSGSTGLVTDVGSTKRLVMASAANAGLTRFVGGHPMSGSERGGLEHARADLFAGRPWLLVSSGGNADGLDAQRAERFVLAMGAEPQWVDAARHDQVMAYVSHVPQLLAVALMNAAMDAIGDAGLAASGRAFKEMTRLASSPAELWQGILADNADNVDSALGQVMKQLPIPGDLEDGQWVRRVFARAAEHRARLLNGDPDSD